MKHGLSWDEWTFGCHNKNGCSYSNIASFLNFNTFYKPLWLHNKTLEYQRFWIIIYSVLSENVTKYTFILKISIIVLSLPQTSLLLHSIVFHTEVNGFQQQPHFTHLALIFHSPTVQDHRQKPKIEGKSVLVSDERGFDFQIIQIPMQLLGFSGWLLCIIRTK